jgi:hypothetical protein
MADIKHLQQDVAYVRTHVENLERMIAHQIRNDPTAKETAKQLFESTPDLARLYLAFDEPANQQTIVKTLGLDKSKVSRLVAILARDDYLQRLPDGRYAWTEFHRLLDLSRIANSAIKAQQHGAAKVASEQVTSANNFTAQNQDSAELGAANNTAPDHQHG